MIDISMEMEQYDCPFIDTTADHDVAFVSVQREFDRSLARLETRMVVEGEDRGALTNALDALRAHDNTTDYDLVRRHEDVAGIRTVIEETEAMAAIRSHEGYITGPFHIDDGSEVWHVGFDRADSADDALAALERNNEYDVLERTNTALPDIQNIVRNAGAAMTLIEGCRDLSETERETLETAVSSGYFETPRDATLGTLADEFDVSKPAVSKNLRRGQRKMTGRVVDALRDLDGE
jgi:predicted DNA binding protein